MKPLLWLVLWFGLPVVSGLFSLSGLMQEVVQTGLCPQTARLPAEPCSPSDFWIKRVLGTPLGWRTYALEWLSWTAILGMAGAVWWGYRRLIALNR